VKKLLWFLASAVLLLSTLGNPVHLNADGNPPPLCPPGKTGCKAGLTLQPEAFVSH
jgi:hypothetical protein